MDFREALKEAKLLPIITLKDDDHIALMKEVIEKSDIEMVEVAYRSDLASKAIKAYSEIPNVLIGAGTVKTVEQAKNAIESGAKFIVAPGYDQEVVNYCQEANVPIVPGVLTPTEILAGMNGSNLSIFKVFPASLVGGLKGIKALQGPFFDVEFLPTGGVSEDNYLEFLANEQVIAVGGSFILDTSIKPDQVDEEVERINALVKSVK